MDRSTVLRKLNTIFDGGQIFIDEPMKNHTSFKIGGPADFLVTPSCEEQIVQLLSELGGEGVFVMGNGSNLLVSDGGIRGIVLEVGSAMRGIDVQDDTLTCQSGALLSAIAAKALKHSLGGFEFAAGIPGALGGGVSMNAGAYGGEMKDVVISTRCADENGSVQTVTDHGFGYRRSVFTDKNWVITQSVIRLREDNPQEIQSKMRDFAERRRSKQPLEFPSAGSTFKRPEGYFAGKLIQDAGLSGFRIGGASVSDKHCGFVINDDGASFDDVVRLIEHIQNEVLKKFNVKLETEVKICGS